MRSSISDVETVVEAGDRNLTLVVETTMYEYDFPIFLRERFEGSTIAELAAVLGVPESHAPRFLSGQWRPTKAMCKRLGLKTVYAVTGVR
jgi:hypothetical protein